MQRMLSSLSGVNGDKIRGLDLSDKDWTRIDVAANQLSKAKIFVDDTSAIRLGDLAVKARKLKSIQFLKTKSGKDYSNLCIKVWMKSDVDFSMENNKKSTI